MKRYFVNSLVAGMLTAVSFHSVAADTDVKKKADLTLVDGRPAATAVAGTFIRDIKPILELHCVKCHGPERPKGGLRLDTLAGAIKGGDNGTVLVPGKIAMSKLYTSTVLAPDADDVMPPKKEPKLTRAQ